MAYAPLQGGVGYLGKYGPKPGSPGGLEPNFRVQAESHADAFIARNFPNFDRAAWSNGRAPTEIKHIAEQWGAAEYILLEHMKTRPGGPVPGGVKALQDMAKQSVQDIKDQGYLTLPDGTIQLAQSDDEGLTVSLFR